MNMACQAIKLLEDKNVANEINFMVWSDRMDLVAFSNIKGEVALHRLSWTRAWSFSPPKENLLVNSIAWRPDGKVLAVGYSNGEVVLLNVENKKVLNIKEAPNEITYLVWVNEKIDTKIKDNFSFKDEEKQDYMKYIDLSKLYIKDPMPNASLDNSTNSDDAKETNFLQEQNELNLLFVGTRDGFVHIRIFGCFTCAILNLNSYLGKSCSVEHIHINEDLSKIFVTVKDAEHNVKIEVIDTQVFKTHGKELFAVAMKYVKLIDLTTYLTSTIANITETWESFLLEIDHKLSKYASKVPEGGVSADFLDLLMFGICSSELQEFLMIELTKKGLEKFGQTIEMSYANIQKLLLKNVTKFGQNLTYHLAELRGMTRLQNRYGVVGLTEDSITQAIQSSGAFLIKAGEMQQIINHSVINYKAFFRWLYGAILLLMDETLPTEIQKMAQQDLAYITEFLQNFDNVGSKDGQKTKGFIMERLGQYLVDAPLTIIPVMNGNDWTSFLKENECVQNHPSILKHYTNLSLIQQFKDLALKIMDIFKAPKNVLEKQFRHLHCFNCFNFGEGKLRMSSCDVSREIVLFGFLQPHNHINFLQVHVEEDKCLARCGKFHFMQSSESTNDVSQILDLSFYSSDILSVLLQETIGYKTGILQQFCLSSALKTLMEIDIHTEIGNNLPSCNASALTPRFVKNTEMAASFFAISGSRSVCIVLSENKRKIKMYEMEADDEDDDDDVDMSSNVLKHDVSMQVVDD